MQYLQHLLVVFAEVFSKNCLVQSLHLYYVLGNRIGSVLVDEPPSHIVCDSRLWLLVEHQDEHFHLLREPLHIADAVQLNYQFTVSTLVLQSAFFLQRDRIAVLQRDRIAVLRQIFGDFLLELGTPLLSGRTYHGLTSPNLLLAQILQLFLVEFYEFRRLLLNLYLYV
ncbi:unnamed protein product [Sphagnum balticum]